MKSFSMRRLFLGTVSAVAGVVALTGAALAGDQYVDSTGFALSGYDPVAYFALEQVPLGEAQPRAVPGSAEITADWNGATWAFSTEANREAFLADPERYAPAYDGHCAYGIAQGGKVPANPHLWRIVDGQLYLNINQQVVGFWEADLEGNLAQSEVNWDALEANPASANEVPAFDPSAAPVGG